MKLIELFWVFLKIGGFSFGGGYGMLPLIEKEVVHIYRWLTSTEFVDIIAISQMSPGPIAINAATFVGFRQYGVIGSIIATLGVVFVSFFLVISLAKIIIKYKSSFWVEGIFSGIRPGVIGLIAAACVSLFKTSILDIKGLIIGIGILVLVYKTKLHPITIIMLSGIMGILIYSF